MKSKDSLIKALKENPYVKEYLELEEQLNNNKFLNDEIKALHSLQQQMVNLQQINKEKAYKEIEKEYWKRRKKLESNPNIKNYLTLQQEINDLLQTIKEILEESLKI